MITTVIINSISEKPRARTAEDPPRTFLGFMEMPPQFRQVAPQRQHGGTNGVYGATKGPPPPPDRDKSPLFLQAPDALRTASPRTARPLGRLNTTCSAMPSSGTTRVAPSSIRRSSTSLTSTSGADAPAVTPTRLRPAIHSAFRSAAVSTM